MIWTRESAALLARAYRYGGAADTLAEKIVPELAAGAHVCDAGCGVGALSLSLAQRGYRVTALDISEIPLEQLRRSGKPEMLARVDVLRANAKAYTPKTPYDAMVFCFFADMAECLHMAKRCCAGDVFYISRDYDTHRFSVGSHPVRYSGYHQARALLDALGVPYACEELALDMGQPFKSMEEARRFYRLYSRDDPALITDDFLISRLMRTEDEQYPWYLPHMRRTGMVHFCVKDIPSDTVDDWQST